MDKMKDLLEKQVKFKLFPISKILLNFSTDIWVFNLDLLKLILKKDF
jgi:hypothetical protein